MAQQIQTRQARRPILRERTHWAYMYCRDRVFIAVYAGNETAIRFWVSQADKIGDML